MASIKNFKEVSGKDIGRDFIDKSFRQFSSKAFSGSATFTLRSQSGRGVIGNIPLSSVSRCVIQDSIDMSSQITLVFDKDAASRKIKKRPSIYDFLEITIKSGDSSGRYGLFTILKSSEIQDRVTGKKQYLVVARDFLGVLSNHLSSPNNTPVSLNTEDLTEQTLLGANSLDVRSELDNLNSLIESFLKRDEDASNTDAFDTARTTLTNLGHATSHTGVNALSLLYSRARKEGFIPFCFSDSAGTLQRMNPVSMKAYSEANAVTIKDVGSIKRFENEYDGNQKHIGGSSPQSLITGQSGEVKEKIARVELNLKSAQYVAQIVDEAKYLGWANYVKPDTVTKVEFSRFFPIRKGAMVNIDIKSPNMDSNLSGFNVESTHIFSAQKRVFETRIYLVTPFWVLAPTWQSLYGASSVVENAYNLKQNNISPEELPEGVGRKEEDFPSYAFFNNYSGNTLWSPTITGRSTIS